MARMLDRMLTEGLRPPAWLKEASHVVGWRRLAEDLMTEAKRCEMIVADNVAEYLYAGTDQEVWKVKRDFPCCAPPFESFWIEFRAPSKIVSRETGITYPDPDVVAHGFWFQAESLEARWRRMQSLSAEETDQMIAGQRQQAEQLIQAMGPERRRHVEGVLRGEAGDLAEGLKTLTPGEKVLVSIIHHEAARLRGRSLFDAAIPETGVAWLLQAYLVTQSRRYGCLGPFISWEFQVGADGSILEDPVVGGIGAADQEVLGSCNAMIFPALLTLSFLNCKNVRRVMNMPDAPLSKKFEKKTGKPLCRFWTLEIEPMREILKREGESEKTGLQRALHICRGHFAVYEERPLFGKYTGSFWKPAHARGAIQEGVVDKVYAMKKIKKP